MKQKYRLYALLAGANFEAVLYMLAAWQGSEWFRNNIRILSIGQQFVIF